MKMVLYSKCKTCEMWLRGKGLAMFQQRTAKYGKNTVMYLKKSAKPPKQSAPLQAI
jgi:hypothetical protein